MKHQRLFLNIHRHIKKERYKLVNDATVTSICEKGIKLNDAFVNSCLERFQVAGVYIFWKDDKIMYVGKSIDLSQRILSSFDEKRKSGINYCSIINCPIVADAHILEVVLITELKPPLNKDCMCDDTSETFFSDLDIEFLKSLRVNIYGGN